MWIVISYVFAYNRDVAQFYFEEYLKIFVMLIASTIVVRKVSQLWTLYLIATWSLAYIAYEVNIKYLTEGRMDIYLNGYGGVDNNGAGLMLAIGVPLALFAWQGTRRRWRWVYLAFVPPILHSVMMTFSRGAMVAVLVACPLMAIRGARWRQFALAFLLLGSLVPYMAGPEIRARFFHHRSLRAGCQRQFQTAELASRDRDRQRSPDFRRRATQFSFVLSRVWSRLSRSGYSQSVLPGAGGYRLPRFAVVRQPALRDLVVPAPCTTTRAPSQ